MIELNDWLSINKISGEGNSEITLTALPYDSDEARNASLTIRTNTKEVILNVIQTSEISITPDDIQSTELWVKSINNISPFGDTSSEFNSKLKMVSRIDDWFVGIFYEPLTTIDEDAFRSNKELKMIVIPNSVTTIGDYAFYYCENLETVILGNGITELNNWVFGSCTSLSSINIPETVTKIGNGAFDYCPSLLSLPITDNITSIGEYAYAGTSFTSITIPDSVTYIGTSAFRGCDSLESITIPDSVTTIANNLFHDCTSLTSFTIPNTVTLIGAYAFSSCSSLASIKIPDSVTHIGEGAFQRCRFTSITIPNKVTTINGSMFTDCDSLETIILGKNVSNIDNFITLDCSKLKKIVCKATTAPTVEYRTFYEIASNGILEYPSGSDYSTWLSTDEFYLGYYGWTGMSVNFDDDNNNEDNEDDNGNDIVVPNNQKITYISSDGNIIIPYNVGGFGANIVSNTYKNGIGTITFDGTVNLFGDEVFYYCDTLTSITIPDSVTYIGSHAFDTCSSLSSISIPDSGVTRIRNSTFRNCISLTSITIPDSVTYIGSMAFEDSKIRKIKCKAIIPPKVTGNTFQGISSGGVLEYPRGSDYSTWLTAEYYLGGYNWTGSPY